MNLHLLPLLLVPALLALWASFLKRKLPCALLLVLAVVVFATFFPAYAGWWAAAQQHATPKETEQIRQAAVRWGWLFGLLFTAFSFGLAKLGRYFSHRRLRKLGLPV